LAALDSWPWAIGISSKRAVVTNFTPAMNAIGVCTVVLLAMRSAEQAVVVRVQRLLRRLSDRPGVARPTRMELTGHASGWFFQYPGVPVPGFAAAEGTKPKSFEEAIGRHARNQAVTRAVRNAEVAAGLVGDT
jgi:hypothetical protein